MSDDQQLGVWMPLQNIRVLDLTWAWAGPHATRLLGDMGADILRIESAQRLDNLRRSGPRPEGFGDSLNAGGNFNQLNRNKQSIRINLKHPDGMSLAKSLAAVSDVVVSNFAPGVMGRLGLDYETLREGNERLVWAAISGFGLTGPQSSHVTFGPPMTFYSGLASITGFGPEDEPRMLGSTYCDAVSGGHAAIAILAAVRHARRTGVGQLVDVSMLEATIGFLPEMVLDYSVTGRVRRGAGNRDDFYSPQGCYRCLGEDEWVAVTVRNEQDWSATVRLLERPELGALTTPAARRERIDEIDAALSAWAALRTAKAAAQQLQLAGVPGAQALTAQGMLEDEHFDARQFFVADHHPEVGVRKIAGLAWAMSGLPRTIRDSAPLFGQHTRSALARVLGLSDEALDDLEEKGVLA